MGITPMEINNKEFKKGFRGYEIDEVDDFLEQVVEDYEKLYKENAALREKLNSLSEKLEHYTKIEATLQNTLVLAQGAADQAKSNSQKEAELIIKNANDTAQRIIDQAHTEVIKITGQYEKIKQEFQLFKSRYKTFIQTQLDLLSEIDTVVGETKGIEDSEQFAKQQGGSIKFSDIPTSSSEEIAAALSTGEKSNPYYGNQKDNTGRTIDGKSKTREPGVRFDDYDDNTY